MGSKTSEPKSSTKTEWRAAALEAIFLTAQSREYFSIEDIWRNFPIGYDASDEVALGRVMLEAIKNEWIEVAPPQSTVTRSIPVNSSVHPAEASRLAAQSSRILARLRLGIADTRDLADLALKYSSRISELRAVGYGIKVIDRDYETGLRLYALLSVPMWRSLLFEEL